MITLDYPEISNGDTIVQGFWSSGSNIGSFQSPVIYINGQPDVAATEERIVNSLESALRDVAITID